MDFSPTLRIKSYVLKTRLKNVLQIDFLVLSIWLLSVRFLNVTISWIIQLLLRTAKNYENSLRNSEKFLIERKQYLNFSKKEDFFISALAN